MSAAITLAKLSWVLKPSLLRRESTIVASAKTIETTESPGEKKEC